MSTNLAQDLDMDFNSLQFKINSQREVFFIGMIRIIPPIHH